LFFRHIVLIAIDGVPGRVNCIAQFAGLEVLQNQIRRENY